MSTSCPSSVFSSVTVFSALIYSHLCIVNLPSSVIWNKHVDKAASLYILTLCLRNKGLPSVMLINVSG